MQSTYADFGEPPKTNIDFKKFSNVSGREPGCFNFFQTNFFSEKLQIRYLAFKEIKGEYFLCHTDNKL